MTRCRCWLIGALILIVAILVVAFWPHRDYRETLTALNELRAVLPQAARPEDFAREGNRLAGLLQRESKHFSKRQLDTANECRFSISLLSADMGIRNYNQRDAIRSGTLPDPQNLVSVQTSAKRAMQALNDLESALEP